MSIEAPVLPSGGRKPLTRVVSGGDVARAIRYVVPNRIAVAYAGVDWHRYIPDIASVEALVVAPRLGTSPRAVREMAAALGEGDQAEGWKRLFFLDHLHAKLYLGVDSAVCGSSNLSANGLSGERLLELAIHTRDASLMSDFSSFFKDAVASAKKLYPTRASKLRRLQALDAETLLSGVVPTVGTFKSGRRQTAIPDSIQELPRFHVVWWQASVDRDYTEGAAMLKEKIEVDFEFVAEDDVRAGDWILAWRLPLRGLPLTRPHVSWVPVHEVIEHAFICDDGSPYSKMAAQRTDKPSFAGDAPFELSPETKRAFAVTLQNKKLARDLIQPNQVFKLDRADKALPAFLRAMKKNSIAA